MGVFGEVADSYDDVPPGYPPDLADTIRSIVLRLHTTLVLARRPR